MKEIGGESKEEERESERDKVIVRVVKQNHRKASQSESIQSLPSNCTVAVARRLSRVEGFFKNLFSISTVRLFLSLLFFYLLFLVFLRIIFYFQLHERVYAKWVRMAVRQRASSPLLIQ